MSSSIDGNLQCSPIATGQNPTEKNDHPYLDFSNPQHFINICPAKIKAAALQIPHDAFLWNEQKIIRFAYEDNQIPEMDERLRLAFWAEYDRCFRQPIKMVMENILRGICSRSFFDSHYCSQWKIILLIITEPYEQKRSLNYAHHLALSEMIKMIRMPIREDIKTGLPDARMYAIKEKIFEYLNEKVNGSTIQKVEVNSKNLHAVVQPPAFQAPQSAEEMDERLNSLLSELQQGQLTAPQTILPVERVIQEAGRVTDAEFVTLRSDRDNSHRE